jgi:signal transduction histidine kinase
LGLGLYLCRLVVERSFGGRIWVASSNRDGTTFKFIVPAVDASIQSRARESAGSNR